MNYEYMVKQTLLHIENTGHIVMPNDILNGTFDRSMIGFSCRECDASWHELYPKLRSYYTKETFEIMLKDKSKIMTTLGFEHP